LEGSGREGGQKKGRGRGARQPRKATGAVCTGRAGSALAGRQRCAVGGVGMVAGREDARGKRVQRTVRAGSVLGRLFALAIQKVRRADGSSGGKGSGAVGAAHLSAHMGRALATLSPTHEAGERGAPRLLARGGRGKCPRRDAASKAWAGTACATGAAQRPLSGSGAAGLAGCERALRRRSGGRIEKGGQKSRGAGPRKGHVCIKGGGSA
jgi:hypothetical protein